MASHAGSGARYSGSPSPRALAPSRAARHWLREVVRSADGVTFWADDTKARSELGTVRPGLQEGFAIRGEALGRSDRDAADRRLTRILRPTREGGCAMRHRLFFSGGTILAFAIDVGACHP